MTQPTLVIVSGYFGPIHVGHLDYIEAGAATGDELFVIVNNNTQQMLKKGKVPIYEPGLDALMQKNVEAGRLSFTTDLKAAVDGSGGSPRGSETATGPPKARCRGTSCARTCTDPCSRATRRWPICCWNGPSASRSNRSKSPRRSVRCAVNG